MKKLLTLFLIATLTISCLVGCASSEPGETEKTGNEETQKSEVTDETTGPAMKLEIVTMQSEDGSAKIELTYNATFYDYSANSSNQGYFLINENADVFAEKYNYPGNMAGGGEIYFYANYNK